MKGVEGVQRDLPLAERDEITQICRRRACPTDGHTTP